MANLLTGIINTGKFIFENPLYTVLLIVGIILMPLEVLDFLLFLLVNFFVAIINLIFWLLVFFVNLILIAINFGLEFIFNALSSFLGSITAPQLELFDYKQQQYISIDLFASNTNLLLIILGLL